MSWAFSLPAKATLHKAKRMWIRINFMVVQIEALFLYRLKTLQSGAKLRKYQGSAIVFWTGYALAILRTGRWTGAMKIPKFEMALARL
jgi:hypothetical protein